MVSGEKGLTEEGGAPFNTCPTTPLTVSMLSTSASTQPSTTGAR